MTAQAFSAEDLDKLASEALTLVELEESRLLTWGFVQVQADLVADLPGMLSRLSPVGRDLWERAQQAGVTPEGVLGNLERRGLVFKNRSGLYRSRFAEATRLLFLLRQQLPWLEWHDAPRLVSDLRLHLQRRRHPDRRTPADELVAAARRLGVSDLELRVANALLRDASGSPLRLARFQVDATLRQIRALRERSDSGLAIGAGTGAGKTKAFYIPALMHIAPLLGPEPWTKVLAIYPRIELLKDQFSEAFGEARKLDAELRQFDKPSVRIGAYYGDTPRSANQLLDSTDRNAQLWDMDSAQGGWVFPSMGCPSCRGKLIWRRNDVVAEARENQAGRYGAFARLSCGACERTIGSEQIALTREQMRRCPPDILFTTTEMLNRRLSRTREHALFGIGAQRPPQLMLLDEIHTYEGMGGAQVAHLLRRWQHARNSRSGQSLVVVGLSATLTLAEHFFARLTGLPIERVSYIFPAEADLIEEGVEYNLVLRGDPVSGTSLLSTSVQTAMLLGRILDTRPDRPGGAMSRGAYGQKIFAFTDTLDVINRWFHIEYDAEARHVLSKLRARPQTASGDEMRRRNEAGQWWWACEQIGHDLESPLEVGLTSSQYRGVSASADLVIATSTLEVGFNDPMVGAVIQHKSPRSLASFLQRKGRAGRRREMRPWMVVVTSAYGRDRWAFQHAEQLFSPTLAPLELPIENIYVRKMQAAYALMDWAAATLAARGVDVDVWDALGSAPHQCGSSLRGSRRAIARLLGAVLSGGPALGELRTHLDAALGLDGDNDALDALLWAEPRPLLLEVIPTVLRQIESNWQSIAGGAARAWSDRTSPRPMPDFVAPNLFSLLSLPELTLRIPDRPAAGAPMRADEEMVLPQGMGEYAPGHVSKRYARSNRTQEAHWLALPDDSCLIGGHLQLADLAVGRDPAVRRVEIDGQELLVYRPRVYTLAITPETVLPTSSARLVWRSRFEPQSRSGALLDVPTIRLALAPDSPWRSIFADVRAFTQAVGSWVEVTRAAVGVRVETRYLRGTEQRWRLRFAESDAPAALGFSLCVDALCARFAPIDAWEVIGGPDWPSLRQHLLPSYMRYRIERDPRLAPRELSDFEVDWLWQLELSMLVATAVARGTTLEEAAEEVRSRRTELADRTMDVIFQSQRVDEEDDLERTGRLRQRLAGLIADPAIAEALAAAHAVLWSAPDQSLAEWLQSCYAASLGAALFDAVTRITADIDPDDLTLDVEGDTIWVAEQTPGGVGLVQRIVEAVAQRPRDLDLQLLDTIRHCDREMLAGQLDAVAELVGQGDAELAAAFTAARATTDVRGHTQVLAALRDALEPHGVPVTRDLMVALNSKILRPSSGADSDELAARLAKRWGDEQRRLGCAIDLRVMAVAAWRLDDIRDLVVRVLDRVGSGPVDPAQVYNQLQSLLWLDCRDSCPDCVERAQPYQRLTRPSRSLLRSLVDPAVETLRYGDPGWLDLLTERLAERYAAQVSCGQDELRGLQEALAELVVMPIEVGYEQHYPAVERVERRGRRWLAGVVLRELAQS